MSGRTTRAGLLPLAAAVAILLATSGLQAQGRGEGGGRSGEPPIIAGKTAGETFKNIQVLKDIPADQLIPTMRFVAASLGVQCAFCHVQGHNELDDKPEKKTARQMMTMMMAINKDNFNGRMQVTCNTCHRGSNNPQSVPAVLTAAMPAPPVPPQEAAGAGRGGSQAPPSDQILSKYVQATGGVDALAKITSRVEKGTVTTGTAQPVPVEVYEKAPDQRAMITHAANGDRVTGYSGDKTIATPGGQGPAGDPEGAKLEDDLYLAANAQKLYTQWRAGPPSKIGDRDVYVLNGSAPGKQAIRLYIDQQSGMLLRMIHFSETALGRMPTQVDYSDYRDMNGVKVPYHIVLATPTTFTTIQLTDVQQNVPVDASKFSPS